MRLNSSTETVCTVTLEGAQPTRWHYFCHLGFLCVGDSVSGRTHTALMNTVSRTPIIWVLAWTRRTAVPGSYSPSGIHMEGTLLYQKGHSEVPHTVGPLPGPLGQCSHMSTALEKIGVQQMQTGPSGPGHHSSETPGLTAHQHRGF